jgi:nucleoid-associated protein
VFTELTGFARGLNKDEDTQLFLDGIDEFSKIMPQEKAAAFKTQVVDYCISQEQRDEPVHYRELSRSLDDVDSEAFVNTMTQYTPENGEEVMMDRRKLRKYVKFAGRDKDLAISFSSFQLNHKVHYQPDSDTLTITGIPSALRKQLQEHLDNKSS